MRNIKIKLFFSLILSISLLFNLPAKADEADDIFCNKSKACKKVCILKRKGVYSDLDPKHRKLMLKCMKDLSIKIN